MASWGQNLLDQWGQIIPECKVLAVCGNLHSRLVPPTEQTNFWPAFAYQVQQSRPDLRVNSVGIVFHGGAVFNEGIKELYSGAEPFGEEAEIRSPNSQGHTLDLHLPRATPVTFLATNIT